MHFLYHLMSGTICNWQYHQQCCYSKTNLSQSGLWAQDRLKLSREQKHQIVAIRQRFLETMRNIMVQRRAATDVLQLPLPMRYEDSASLMCFADATIASEKSLLLLCQQQKDAYRLMQHSIREVGAVIMCPFLQMPRLMMQLWMACKPASNAAFDCRPPCHCLHCCPHSSFFADGS